MKPVRLAIIGCGGYASQLIKRIRTLPREAVLVAAISQDPGSVEAQDCAAHGARVIPAIGDLLDFAPGRVDAILNPTPIHLHKPLTQRCIEAGFPVWLEKPPVATLAGFDELLAASGPADIQVCFNTVYAFQIQKLKAELVRGDYGEVRRVRGVGGWIRTDAYFARAAWAGKLKVGDDHVYDGTINNPLAHLLFNNLFLAAPEHHALAIPESVEAGLWHGHDIESEDTSSLRIITREGVEILAHLTLCPEEEIAPLTVVDTGLATISIHDFNAIRIDWHDGRCELRESYKENRIEMLENLCQSFREGTPGLCPLPMTRPFTQSVSAAFDQVLAAHGGIPAIGPEHLERFPAAGSTGTKIRGINALLLLAHENGLLLHELAENKIFPRPPGGRHRTRQETR